MQEEVGLPNSILLTLISLHIHGQMILQAETFGFRTYQPAYLNLYFKGKNILNGANFASAGSGYHHSTSEIFLTLSMDKQLVYYMDCQKELRRIVGLSHAASIISDAIYIVCAGSADFTLNYYSNVALGAIYTPEKFADILVQNYANFIKELYALGARKIGVATLPAIGCLPRIIHDYGFPNRDRCVDKINNVAVYFNQQLNSTSVDLQKMLPSLKLVLLDSYLPLYNLVNNPSEYGFSESREGCFGHGIGVTKNTNSSFVDKKTFLCPNVSKYVFWDGFHPTEAANKFLAAELIPQTISLIS